MECLGTVPNYRACRFKLVKFEIIRVLRRPSACLAQARGQEWPEWWLQKLCPLSNTPACAGEHGIDVWFSLLSLRPKEVWHREALPSPLRFSNVGLSRGHSVLAAEARYRYINLLTNLPNPQDRQNRSPQVHRRDAVKHPWYIVIAIFGTTRTQHPA